MKLTLQNQPVLTCTFTLLFWSITPLSSEPSRQSPRWTAVAVIIALIIIGWVIFGLHSQTTVIVNGQELHGWDKFLASMGGGLFTLFFFIFGVAFIGLAIIGTSLLIMGLMALGLVLMTFMIAPSILPWLLGLLVLLWITRKGGK
ncbi:hypothetical protein ACKC9G_11950 [Pokkaliibacter sp. CJK22405]|uniref:hypothetical protein n=1 Tax=Pokkaliibacter sp. CJK22405 TaxID=3384615 RepID=UPI003984B0DF